jgi:hypothetical protein
LAVATETPNNGRQDPAEAIRATLGGRRDAVLPPGVAAELAATYRNSLRDYRQHSLEFLEAEDYQQAAEKAWGAFAESVKSIAADYGMRLAHHALIIRVTGSLATLAAQDDPDAEAVLSIGLDSARSLHQHFYENDLPPGQVKYSAARVAEAIDLMQQRFGAAGNGFV